MSFDPLPYTQQLHLLQHELAPEKLLWECPCPTCPAQERVEHACLFRAPSLSGSLDEATRQALHAWIDDLGLVLRVVNLHGYAPGQGFARLAGCYPGLQRRRRGLPFPSASRPLPPWYGVDYQLSCAREAHRPALLLEDCWCVPDALFAEPESSIVEILGYDRQIWLALWDAAGHTPRSLLAWCLSDGVTNSSLHLAPTPDERPAWGTLRTFVAAVPASLRAWYAQELLTRVPGYVRPDDALLPRLAYPCAYVHYLYWWHRSRLAQFQAFVGAEAFHRFMTLTQH